MKTMYARAASARNAGSNDMCGGGQQGGGMCGPSQGSNGGGLDPNILNMLMGMGNQGGANPMNGAGNAANPMNGAMAGGSAPNPMQGAAGGNPMQNLLMQSLLGGGNGMNMCGPSSGGGGMC